MPDEELYERLAGMKVPLEYCSQLGPSYLIDKLMDCRRKQDEACDIALLLGRERASLLAQHRAVLAAERLGNRSPRLTAERSSLETALEDNGQLGQVLEVVRGNLNRTSTDINLILRSIAQQAALGEVPPPRRVGRR